MQEFIDSFQYMDANNLGFILTWLWLPAIALCLPLLVFALRNRPRIPADLLVFLSVLLVSMCVFALEGAWLSFAHFSVAAWLLQTGIQLAVVAVAAIAIRSGKGLTLRLPEAGAGSQWERRRKVMAVPAIVLGLLLAAGNLHHISRLFGTTPAVATVTTAGRDRSGTIGAEWQSAAGKKLPLLLQFDSMYVYKPKIGAGLQLPIRMKTADAAAETPQPFYLVDNGIGFAAFDGLARLVFSLGLCATGLAMFRAARKTRAS